MTELLAAIAQITWIQAAWAAAFATLASAATFAAARTGALWPCALAAATAAGAIALWANPAFAIDYVRGLGLAQWLPRTHQDLSLWFAATAAGSAAWLLATIAGLAANTIDSR